MRYEEKISSPIGEIKLVPLSKKSQIIGEENYLYESPPEFLEKIGFNTGKFHDRTTFRSSRLTALSTRIELPKEERNYYVVFPEQNNIPFGQVVLIPDEDVSSAHAHFHIWEENLRNRGLGGPILKAGLKLLMDLQSRKAALIEPHRDNAPMNKLMIKCEFNFLRESTFSGPVTHAFPSNVYEIQRENL